MEMSTNFMDSIDLQNGVFEQEGLELLRSGRTKEFRLLGTEKDLLVHDNNSVDLDAEIQKPKPHANQYSDLFNL